MVRTEGMEEGSEGVKEPTCRRWEGRRRYIIMYTGQLRMNWCKTSLAGKFGKIYQLLPKLLRK